jgi:hypothetical protein
MTSLRNLITMELFLLVIITIISSMLMFHLLVDTSNTMLILLSLMTTMEKVSTFQPSFNLQELKILTVGNLSTISLLNHLTLKNNLQFLINAETLKSHGVQTSTQILLNRMHRVQVEKSFETPNSIKN